MDHLIYLTPKQTERLIIRPLTLEDTEQWRSFLSDEICTKYFPKQLANPDVADDWIKAQLNRYDEGRFGLMALIDKENGVFIGQCGLLHQEVNGRDELEVGYHLLSAYHGKGYASEASQFFKKLGFAFTEAPRIISLIHPDNKPSQAVARRNGMTPAERTTHKDMEAIVYEISRLNFKSSENG